MTVLPNGVWTIGIVVAAVETSRGLLRVAESGRVWRPALCWSQKNLLFGDDSVGNQELDKFGCRLLRSLLNSLGAFLLGAA